jgi:Gram-negative bacterial TonB protein C-terminal
MPDAARIAQAQALEVPLILQGAKTSDGTGHRELFKENATTTLVFENGAVLNLRTKLTVGQAVFIHNEQNGREILCKVVEAPAEGEAGHTEIEFSTADPDFWNAAALRSGAGAPDPWVGAAKPTASAPPDAPGDDNLAMMSESTSKIHLPNMVKPGKESGGPLREELVPAHEMVPNSSVAPSVPIPDFEPAATTAADIAEPTGEQIDAALKQMSGAVHAATPLEGAELEQDQKHMAALMERDARLAKFAAFKEKQADKIQRDFATKTASKVAPQGGTERDKEFEASGEAPPIWAKATALDKLTTGKNATYLTISIAILIVVAIGFLWHSMRAVINQPSDAPMASAPVQPAANPATPATPPAEIASTNAPQPVAAAAPKASALRASAEVRAAANRDKATARAEAAAIADAARARSEGQNGAGGAELVPAKILSQPQPTLPPWAKDMELDGVVTMDVTISDRGTVAATRVLTGPRALQHEAERALSLWQFQPGQSGGKPAASHLTLSVEFLPPPPPKRYP